MKKRLLAILFYTILIFSLCACDGNTAMEAASAMIESSTASPIQTKTPTQAEATAPTEESMPTMDAIEQQKNEINQNITDFLNYEGEFTQKKIDDRKNISSNVYWKESPVKLGLMTEPDGCVSLQGVILGCFERNGILIEIIGFDGNDGNRFVTAGKIETSSYKGGNIFFCISGIDGVYFGTCEVVEDTLTNDGEIIKKHVQPLVGKTATFQFPIGDIPKNVLKEMAEDTPELQAIQDNYLNERNGSFDLSKALAGHVDLNEMELGFQIPKGVKIKKITEIENVGDEFEIDNSLIPLIEAVFYKAER